MVSKKTKTIVVMSGKGGVGKSTVSANIAYGLAERGHRVGIFDSDFHGPTIPRLLGVKGGLLDIEGEKIIPISATDNLEVVSMEFLLPDSDTPLIWRGPMKMNMITQFIQKIKWSDPDYIVIDLPPGTGDEPLSIAQEFASVSGVLIVTTPQEVALDAVRKSINFARKLNMNILGVIENMSDFKCPHCDGSVSLFGKGGGKEMSKELGVDYLGSIPFDMKVARSCEKGVSFYDVDNHSSIVFEKMIDLIQKKMM